MTPMRAAAVSDLLDEGGQSLLRGLAGLCAVLLLLAVVMVFVAVLVVAALFAPASPAAPPPPVLASARGAAANPAPGGIVDIARRYLGIPYVFGGTNPSVGLDCSGLVQLVYRQAGLSLPRTAQQQFDATLRVASDQLQPGDLVFFARTYPDPRDWITHVGIYIGGGMQINAPTEGQVVSIQPVLSGFWGSHFASGGRIPATDRRGLEETR